MKLYKIINWIVMLTLLAVVFVGLWTSDAKLTPSTAKLLAFEFLASVAVVIWTEHLINKGDTKCK